MKHEELDYLLIYLDQLELKLEIQISEIQQTLTHVRSIKKFVTGKKTMSERFSIVQVDSALGEHEKPDDSLLRIKEICNLLGVSRTKLYRMIQNDEFPTPLVLGPRLKVWQKKTVLAWVTKKAIE